MNTAHGELEVLWAPDIVTTTSCCTTASKVLIAGDAFMAALATPNPDVDSLRWIDTLERLLALPIDVLVEGHGHIHTLRADIPSVRGVVFF